MLGKGGFLKPNFSGFVTDGTGGKVRWHNNSDGFRNDREFFPFPSASTIRIISMGDSFTAGYRVAQEETFSSLLDRWINQMGTPAEVMISCVESPGAGLSWLQRFGVDHHPDVVLLGLTLGNDIAQAYIDLSPTPIGFAHGLETFLIPDQCIEGSLSRWRNLETKLARNRPSRLHLVNLFRNMIHFPDESPESIASWYEQSPGTICLFDAINGLGMYIKEPPEEIREAYRRLFRILQDYKRLADRHKIDFAVMLFPQRYQIQPQDWGETVRVYGLKPEAFDLDAPNRRISMFCREQSILVIDPTEEMRKKRNEKEYSLYLPLGDMHWNSRGHRVFFESIRDKIAELILSTANRKLQSSGLEPL